MEIYKGGPVGSPFFVYAQPPGSVLHLLSFITKNSDSMEKKDLVEGMRLYIYKLRVDGRYSTAKSYQDALNSFMRFCGLEVIPYIYVNKENLRRYQAFC